MALIRGLGGRVYLLDQLSRASAPVLSSRATLAGFATRRSSDDDEGPSSAGAKDEQSDDASYPHGRADLRIWVDNLLSTLEPAAKPDERGKASVSAQEQEEVPSAAQPGISGDMEQATAGSIEDSFSPVSLGTAGQSEQEIDLPPLASPSEQKSRLPPSASRERPPVREASEAPSTVGHLSRGEHLPVRQLPSTGEPSTSGKLPTKSIVSERREPEAQPTLQQVGGPVTKGMEVPRRTTVREMPIAALPDSVVGYQELGLGDVQDGPALLDQGSGRINTLRTFWPSHLYDPEDLVLTTTSYIQQKPWMKQTVKVKKATNSEAIAQADFRNVSFLHRFTSEAGQLPPRRVTRLQNKVHKHVMRQIKTARQMALLPPDGKILELLPGAQQYSSVRPPPQLPPRASAMGGAPRGALEGEPRGPRSDGPQRRGVAPRFPPRPNSGPDRPQQTYQGVLQRVGSREGQEPGAQGPVQPLHRPPLRLGGAPYRGTVFRGSRSPRRGPESSPAAAAEMVKGSAD